MTFPRPAALLLAAAALAVPSFASFARADGEVGKGVPGFKVRDGYKVTLAAEDFGEARFLQFGDDGTLYVSQPRAGKIVAMKDTNGDGVYDQKTDFVTGQPAVHGMDFKDGFLYFTSAQEGFCRKAEDKDHDGKADAVIDVIKAGGIPSGGGHPFRGVLVGADKIYITVSDPQNMTDKLPSDRKTIYTFDLDGSNRQVFCTGIRNTEKIRFRPDADGKMTDEVWGSDHGSDWFGKPYGDTDGNQPITDLLPPGELNHYVKGGFYGHPFIVGNRIPRPEYANRKDIHELAAKTTPPAWDYHAHVAPNGHCFLQKDYFPGQRGDFFAAFHGSWNSSKRVGYSVDRILFDKSTGLPYGELTVVDCFDESGNRVLDRPVDCAEAPDGTILFSADQTNRIYRISKAD